MGIYDEYKPAPYENVNNGFVSSLFFRNGIICSHKEPFGSYHRDGIEPTRGIVVAEILP